VSLTQGIIWALSVVVSLFIGGFLKSYMSKKGENLATKEDIAELTRVQKEIEAKISDEVWNRQRKWELKKEVVLEAVRELSNLETSVMQLYAGKAAMHGIKATPEDQIRNPLYAQMSDKFVEVSARFKRVTMLMDIVCGESVVRAFREVDSEIDDALSNSDMKITMNGVVKFHHAIPGLLKLIREDLAS
jgi:hypothetical protein